MFFQCEIGWFVVSCFLECSVFVDYWFGQMCFGLQVKMVGDIGWQIGGEIGFVIDVMWVKIVKIVECEKVVVMLVDFYLLDNVDFVFVGIFVVFDCY